MGAISDLIGGPHRGYAVFAQHIPADDPVAAGFNKVKGLAGADDADYACLVTECIESVARDVCQLEPILPLRVIANDRLMQLMQPAELLVVQRSGHDHGQVEVAGDGIKISADQGAVQIDADHPLSEDILNAARQPIQNEINLRMG